MNGVWSSGTRRWHNKCAIYYLYLVFSSKRGKYVINETKRGYYSKTMIKSYDCPQLDNETPRSLLCLPSHWLHISPLLFSSLLHLHGFAGTGHLFSGDFWVNKEEEGRGSSIVPSILCRVAVCCFVVWGIW